ncbi:MULTISPECIES: hypothetical protein [Paenibacillus]|nr:hypothetical protein [Paenibacillus alvei]MCY7484184.1 hypothetical protein [Paenibacillus alvei]
MFWNEGTVAGHRNYGQCVFVGERGKRSGKSSKPACQYGNFSGRSKFY